MDYTPPPAIVQAAKQSKQPELLLAISYVESRWNVNALGKAGEIGALQIHPRHHKVPTSLTAQFQYADKYLRYLERRCGRQLFLACYNMGPRKVMNSLDNNIGWRYTLAVQGVYYGIKKDTQNRRPITRDQGTIRYAADD